MNRPNVSLNFHNDFAPTLRYIAEIVRLASNNFIGDKDEISEETGIPTGDSSGKVVPHIKYAKFMGLIESDILRDGKYNLQLTPLGRVIYLEDRYFMDRISKYLINYFLCDKEEGAPHWSFIFNNFNYMLDSEYELSTIEKEARVYFDKNAKMTVLKSMYTGDYGFEDLMIITQSPRNNLVFKRCQIQQDCYYMYGYTLLYSWEKYFKDKLEISIDTIIEELRWSNKFGFDYNTTLEVFDELESLGIIKMNKQLSPITIIKTSEAEEIMFKIYDLAL